MTQDNQTLPSFEELELSAPVIKALNIAGYEIPSPIQATCIPLILNGRDVLGQAQTGTGKTAAFALPIISRLNTSRKKIQVLTLTPTRELAIQVAEAFQGYASQLKNFHVLPIYGGQSYGVQLRQLKRGVHVVTGTPGRVIDHIKRGTLDLSDLTHLILDEADEMLRMGFIEDVEWILEQTPKERQTLLFSATLPPSIKKIAQVHLKDPEEITIKVKTTTAETINQRFWGVSGLHKIDALTRILEAEPFDGMIVFVRTKTATVELAEKLEARGFAARALNGDIPQNQRERTIEQLKNGKLDILVATDVAARGLDVDRISHVINYDIPYDTESYIHRVGRTGRMGKTGEAILFVSPRERRLLRAIENATNKRIERMELPSTESINDQRIARFKQKITDTTASEGLEFYTEILEQYRIEHDIPAMEIAAALAKLVQGDEPLLLEVKKEALKHSRKPDNWDRAERPSRGSRREPQQINSNMERYRIEVGHNHQVNPGQIVGAIANEAGLDSQHIGQIKIYNDFSTVELPKGMPKPVFRILKKAWVAGQQLRITRELENRNPRQGPHRRNARDMPFRKNKKKF